MGEESKPKMKTELRILRAVIIGVVVGFSGVGLLIGYKALMASWVAGDSKARRLYALRSFAVNTGDLSDPVLEKAVAKASTPEEKDLLCIHLAYARPPFSYLSLSEYIVEEPSSLRQYAGEDLDLALHYALSSGHEISPEHVKLLEERLRMSLSMDGIEIGSRKYKHWVGRGGRPNSLERILEIQRERQ